MPYGRCADLVALLQAILPEYTPGRRARVGPVHKDVVRQNLAALRGLGRRADTARPQN